MPNETGQPTPEDYVDENVRDGKEGLNIFGNPKQGKSNTANRICKDEMLKYGKNIIMPGDVNCEFRNLLYHKHKPIKEFDILVPKDCEFKFANMPNWVEKHIKRVDYSNDIILEDYLKNKSSKLLVIFDDHLDDLIYWKRLQIWNDISKQLIRRTFELERPIILRFDEAGVYFPEIALSDHYRMIYRFNYLNVSFRKSQVQIILIAQIDTEMKSTIHGKQTWRICKKGAYSKRIPRVVRKAAPFFSRDQFALFNGGIYNKECFIYKMEEAPVVWKMIPTTDYESVEMTGADEKERKKYVYESLKFIIPQYYEEWKDIKGFTKSKLAKLSGVPTRTVHTWVTEFENSKHLAKIKENLVAAESA